MFESIKVKKFFLIIPMNLTESFPKISQLASIFQFYRIGCNYSNQSHFKKFTSNEMFPHCSCDSQCFHWLKFVYKILFCLKNMKKFVKYHKFFLATNSVAARHFLKYQFMQNFQKI